jgi:RND family efflux transporter MFP subunit
MPSLKALTAAAVIALMAAPDRPARSEIVAETASCLVRPRHVIQLGSPVFGALAKVMVDRADPVKEGQIVAKLDTTIEEAQMALDRHKAENTAPIDAVRVDLAWNERELARRQKLAGNMFSKINDVDEYVTKVAQDKIELRKVESDLENARLEAARSQAQYNLKLIRSPVNGVVSEIKLSPGEYIYEQTPIMTLVEIDPLNIDLVVPAERYLSLSVGMTAQVHLLPPVDATVAAKVDAIDPIIDAASDTFRVRLVLPNPEYKIPSGVRCAAHLEGPS